MISRAAFCPHPPLLVPEAAGSAAAELDVLRAACQDAITTLAGRQLLVIGSGETSVVHAPLGNGTLAGFGVPLGDGRGGTARWSVAATALPLSLTLGAWLIREVLGPESAAVGYAVGPDFATSAAAVDLRGLAGSPDVALLVMGDGSARRSTRAPGFLDERAEAFDQRVAAALADGDGATLAGLDLELGAELLAAGAPAWRAAGIVLTGERYDATLTYDQAPYGVGYFVASWAATGSTRA